MKKKLVILASLLVQAAAAWGSPTSPVVAELFESQGCSSCPPAERVMKNLEKEFGTSVILLTYHVDYWDYLGWKDPFSNPRYTERQKEYGRVFSQDSIYTPELVIQGETGFNGSDLGQARREIKSRLGSKLPGLDVRLTRKSADSLAVTAQVPPELESRVKELTLVIYENAPRVQVLRGENRGETMSGDFAVRHLVNMPMAQVGRFSQLVSVDRAWNQEALGIAVLARDENRRILGAQEVRLK